MTCFPQEMQTCKPENTELALSAYQSRSSLASWSSALWRSQSHEKRTLSPLPVEYLKSSSFAGRAGYQLSRALDSESKPNIRCVYSTCLNRHVYHKSKNLSVCYREIFPTSVTVHAMGPLPVVKRNLIFSMTGLGFSPADKTGSLFLNPFKWESDWLKGRVGAG